MFPHPLGETFPWTKAPFRDVSRCGVGWKPTADHLLNGSDESVFAPRVARTTTLQVSSGMGILGS